jgi:hypothetical protein
VDFTEILKDFGRAHGLERLTLDERGQCALELDRERRLIIDHRPGAAAVYLRVPLALPSLAESAQIELYRRLLAANLLGEETRGAVFAIDADEETIELHRRLLLREDLTTDDFTQCLGELYGAAEHFAAELALSFVLEDEPAPQAGDEDEEMMTG